MTVHFPYDRPGQWYRGNLHCHTTNSDGGKTAAEVAEFYRSHGYDFLAIADHGTLTPWKEHCTKRFVCLPAEELGNPHMLGFGIQEEIDDSLDFGEQIAAIREQGGLPILAHPAWMGLWVEEIYEHTGLLGMEIYNYICSTLNGKGHSLNMWDELLHRGYRLWGFAVDDAHMSANHPGAAKGWIVVRAPELSAAAILDSIETGCFYSSTGPTIEDIALDGDELTVRCSPCDSIVFVGAAHHGTRFNAPDDCEITEATYQLNPSMQYCRVECRAGTKTAWANPIFLE